MLLEVDGLTGGYGTTTVLRDVSLTIKAGSVVALLGPNGAGKSTTLRMVSGLLRPSKGTVRFEGRDVTSLGPAQRSRLGICHVMEGRSIFPSLTVRENLLLQAPRGTPAAEIYERADAAFPQLTKRRSQVAGTLSGGEQQMLALMRTYLSKPKIVLVDEASLGLAPLIVDQIFEFLVTIVRSGASLLLVEQYVNRALKIASTVNVLSQGHHVHSGAALDLDEATIFSLYAQQPVSGDRRG